MLSFLLAIAFIGWAFRSGKGRRLAYIAYLPILLVTALFFVEALGRVLGLGVLEPIAMVFIGLFVTVLALGVYGYATRHRRPSMICVKGTIGIQHER